MYAKLIETNNAEITPCMHFFFSGHLADNALGLVTKELFKVAKSIKQNVSATKCNFKNTLWEMVICSLFSVKTFEAICNNCSYENLVSSTDNAVLACNTPLLYHGAAILVLN